MNHRHLHAALRPPDGGEPAAGPLTPHALRTLDGGTVPPEMVTAVVHAVMAVLTWQADAFRQRARAPSPMLTVGQAAALMGMSRTTVIRKADTGELPCVVMNRGTRQKMRRFPRALIEDLAARGGPAAQTDLGDYTARWCATVRQLPDEQHPPASG